MKFVFKILIVGALLFTLVRCSHKPDSTVPTSPKYEQYFVHGEQLYLTHCSNCHQKTGVGLGLLYPPLNKSDFMEDHLEKVICIIKNGINGELVVNGKSFNKAMPGIPTLTDLEIAEIATYIYNSWEHAYGIVEVRDVSGILTECNSQE